MFQAIKNVIGTGLARLSPPENGMRCVPPTTSFRSHGQRQHV